ncbi:MAG: hypothetical protein QM796_18620 [Chthoniobacteraceae bacterium]
MPFGKFTHIEMNRLLCIAVATTFLGLELGRAATLSGNYTVVPYGTDAGDFTVSGMLDVYGNSFKFGTAGSTGYQGLLYSYTDSASGNSSILLTAYRNSVIWRWQQNNGAADKMVLDQNNALTLVAPGYASGSVGKVVITPSLSGSTITLDGNALLTSASAVGTYVQKSASQIVIGSGAWAGGINATVVGPGSCAVHDYSTAIGMNSYANGSNAVVVGGGQDGANAIGNYAVAIGDGTYAGGESAVGLNGSVVGDYSTAIGNGSEVFGNSSTAMGGGVDIAFVQGDYSIALGDGTWVSGEESSALGCGSAAYGDWASGVGVGSIASGNYSAAFAGGMDGARAYGDYSISIGDLSYADNLGSTALGPLAIANGDYSTAIGNNATSTAAYSTVIGQYNIQRGNSHTWVDTDDLFVVGNGKPQVDASGNPVYGNNGLPVGNPSNAFVVKKNGDATVGGVIRVQRAAGDIGMGIFIANPPQ